MTPATPLVLIVTQHAERALALRDGFAAHGVAVKLADTLAGARLALATDAPRLVVLARTLPDGSAAEWLAEIKSDADTADVPVMLLGAERPDSAGTAPLIARALDLIGGQGPGSACGRLRAQRRRRVEGENRRLHAELVATEARHSMALSVARADLLADLARKNAELAAAKERAEEATTAKSRFLAHMAHEIRTPLNALLGVADLLRETPLSPQQAAYVEMLQRAGDSLFTLVNDVLDLSKIEAGRLDLEQIDFSLPDLASEALAIAAGAMQARGKRLELVSDLDPRLPGTLRGDSHRLLQVLNNLLGNAVKFTAQGRVTLAVAPGEGPPGTLHVWVSDTGPGIPADKQLQIFDVFAQADTSTTRRYGGSGLGLSIARRLVELMGGRIWVESQLGAGSAFHFTVPLAVADSGAPAVDAAEAAQGRALRILLAEDVPDNRRIFEAYFQGTPHRCEFAENGQEAVNRFATGHYDLVLMDMQMPVMDGYAATREIRRIEAQLGRAPTPILALTAAAFKDETERCREAGCTACLTKPIRRREFLAALDTHAGDGRTGGGSIQVAIDAELAPIVPAYLANRRAEVAELERVVERADFELLREHAHVLTGTGGTYGFDRITEYGRQLSGAARACDAAAARAVLAQYEAFLKSAEVVYRPG